MSKIKGIIAGLGVVTGFSIAMVPMATFADDPVIPAGQSTINANIDDGISMKLISSGSTGNKTKICDSGNDPNCSGVDQVASTTILPSQADLTSMYTDTYISTNSLSGFTLTLTDSDNNTNLAMNDSDATIAAISTQPVGGSNPGWAIKLGDESSTWYAIPALEGPASAITVNSASNPGSVTINSHVKVIYGVAASSTQASGIYHDTVIYTATAL